MSIFEMSFEQNMFFFLNLFYREMSHHFFLQLKRFKKHDKSNAVLIEEERYKYIKRQVNLNFLFKFEMRFNL